MGKNKKHCKQTEEDKKMSIVIIYIIGVSISVGYTDLIYERKRL